MIAHVHGTLADVLMDAVIIEVGGIGLHVQIPANVLSHLPSKILLHNQPYLSVLRTCTVFQ